MRSSTSPDGQDAKFKFLTEMQVPERFSGQRGVRREDNLRRSYSIRLKITQIRNLLIINDQFLQTPQRFKFLRISLYDEQVIGVERILRAGHQQLLAHTNDAQNSQAKGISKPAFS